MANRWRSFARNLKTWLTFVCFFERATWSAASGADFSILWRFLHTQLECKHNAFLLLPQTFFSTQIYFRSSSRCFEGARNTYEARPVIMYDLRCLLGIEFVLTRNVTNTVAVSFVLPRKTILLMRLLRSSLSLLRCDLIEWWSGQPQVQNRYQNTRVVLSERRIHQRVPIIAIIYYRSITLHLCIFSFRAPPQSHQSSSSFQRPSRLPPSLSVGNQIPLSETSSPAPQPACPRWYPVAPCTLSRSGRLS